MADGGLTIHLDEALAQRLKRAADAAGDTVDAYAARALDFAIEPDRDWAIDQAIADEAIATGDFIPLEDFLARMDRFGQTDPSKA